MKIMLDSGGFSFFSKHKNKVSQEILDNYLNSYINFIKENKNMFELIAGLDIIYNPSLSYNLFSEMKRRLPGVYILPTIHYGTEYHWIKKYYEEFGCDYIAVGGLAKRIHIPKEWKYWLDGIFDYIEKNNFKIKIHGFAITSIDLMNEYPFFSVDSSTYIREGVFGSIFYLKNEKFLESVRILISNWETNEGKYLRNKHFNNLNSYLKKSLENYIENNEVWDLLDLKDVNINRKIEFLSENGYYRILFNVFVFKKIEEIIKFKRGNFVLYFAASQGIFDAIQRVKQSDKNLNKYIPDFNILQTFFYFEALQFSLSFLKNYNFLENIKEE